MEGIRSPAVAGSFYPEDPDELRLLIDGFLGDAPHVSRSPIGVVVPHAGLIFSGPCAAAVFTRVSIPRVAVILAPNHTGVYRSPRVASCWPSGAFRTPLGDVSVAQDFVSDWCASTPLLDTEREPHLREHAVELELPFIQVLSPETAIVPVILPWDSWDLCRDLGESLANVVKTWSDEILLVASSDMNHFESATVAETKDRHALKCVHDLDGQALLDACERLNITMCGRAPTATLLHGARQLGGTKAELVDYRHSGLVTGDNDRVVSYAGLVVT